MIRHIKKYKNRKMYDAIAGRYITLDEVLDLFLVEPLRVEDFNLKDVTKEVVLAAICQYVQRKKEAFFFALIDLVELERQGAPLNEVEIMRMNT